MDKQNRKQAIKTGLTKSLTWFANLHRNSNFSGLRIRSEINNRSGASRTPTFGMRKRKSADCLKRASLDADPSCRPVVPQNSPSVLDLLDRKRGNKSQAAQCVCCSETLAALSVGEHVIVFEDCSHSAHEDCWDLWKTERLQRQPRRVSVDLICPRCKPEMYPEPVSVETQSLPAHLESALSVPPDDLSEDASTTVSQTSLMVPKSPARSFKPKEGGLLERRNMHVKALVPLPEHADVTFEAPQLALKIPKPQFRFVPELQSVEPGRNGVCSLSTLLVVAGPKSLSNRTASIISKDSGYSNSDSAQQSRPSTSSSAATQEPSTPMATSNNKLRDLLVAVHDLPGLDAEALGKLLLWSQLRIGLNNDWKVFDCCLFEQVMICLRENDNRRSSMGTRFSVKGSIVLSEISEVVDTSGDGLFSLSIHLEGHSLKIFSCIFNSSEIKDGWFRALLRRNEPALLPPSSDRFDPAAIRPSSGTSLALSTSTVYTQLFSSGSSVRVNGVCRRVLKDTISEPAIKVTSDHIPIDLILVVPISANMSGIKLTSLKEACIQISAQLNQFDRFALILYGIDQDKTQIVIPFTNRHNIEAYTSVINDLVLQDKADAGKDLEAALALAISTLVKGAPRACLSHIILLSDSALVPNELSSAIIPRLKDARVAVHVLGYGPDHAVDVLAHIADESSGSYTYIEDFMSLKDSMTGCVLGIMSICQVDLCVDITVPVLEYGMHSLRIISIKGARQSSVAPDGQSGKAVLPFLCLGERKEILVKLQHEGENLRRGVTLEVVRATAAFRHLTAAQRAPNNSKIHAKLVLPVRASENIPNPCLLVRSLEILVSEMLVRALDMVANNQHRSSIRILAETRKILQSIVDNDFNDTAPDKSRTVALNKLTGLMEDLTILRRCISSTEDSNSGTQFAVQEQAVLLHQRSWTMNTHSQQFYASQIALIKDYCGRGLLLF